MNSQDWKSLKEHYSKIENRKIKSLFNNKNRFENFSSEAAGLFLDFSKTNIDRIEKEMLLSLIEKSGVLEKKQAMFSGKKLNTSENRSALHFALRSTQKELIVDKANLMSEINATLRKMINFSTGIRSGKIKPSNKKKFTDVINIGIGGSDLGPKMVTSALHPYHDGPKCHFVSNVDSADLQDTLKNLDPENTLIVIASKTFTTIETITNARTAIQWLEAHLSHNISNHLVAISSNTKEVKKYGITSDRIFEFSYSVGGRYSLWGPIGLLILLALGERKFLDFLSGAEEMDNHFFNKRLDENLPVLLAMTSIWHRNICRYSTRAILPYEHRLSNLPAYLQQLDMESNGKRVTVNGEKVQQETAPVVWGQVGTNGQHAFYQMIHQGTSVIPCEFLIGAEGHEPHLQHQHDLLIANCLAQSEALMNGKIYDTTTTAMAFKEIPGNKPSITIMYHKLTPKILGSLISLFEHRTFVEGVVWGVNSFDQWGVELGKTLSTELLPKLSANSNLSSLNTSTAGLLRKISSY
jgi:glucose-6-phosphate isomerase